MPRRSRPSPPGVAAWSGAAAGLDSAGSPESGTRVRLDVVDQLGPARVAWDDGGSTDLPRDQPTRRTVTLVSTADGWRIGWTRAA